MAVSPALETERLVLRSFTEAHLTPRYVGWLNDPDVVRWSEQRHRHHDLESCRRYWESFADSPSYFWAIEENSGRYGHIGNITAYVDPANLLADVAILIGEKDLWGHGYGIEAWNAVMAFLLDDGGMRKVAAGTMATNEGMLRLMRKSDMIDDGRRRRHFIVGDNEVDLILAARFADDKT
jgi:RimJ/RimL family protein N-acetyltransferase